MCIAGCRCCKGKHLQRACFNRYFFVHVVSRWPLRAETFSLLIEISRSCSQPTRFIGQGMGLVDKCAHKGKVKKPPIYLFSFIFLIPPSK